MVLLCGAEEVVASWLWVVVCVCAQKDIFWSRVR